MSFSLVKFAFLNINFTSFSLQLRELILCSLIFSKNLWHLSHSSPFIFCRRRTITAFLFLLGGSSWVGRVRFIFARVDDVEVEVPVEGWDKEIRALGGSWNCSKLRGWEL